MSYMGRILKGICLFDLKEYSSALISFKKCYSKNCTPEIERWIQKCQVHLTQKSLSKPELIFDFIPGQNALPFVQEPLEPVVHYDYFQSLTHVVLLIDIIGLKKDESFVTFHEKSVDVYVDKYDTYLNFKLASKIDPGHSTFTIVPYSIECKLLKETQEEWPKFEETDEPADQ